MIDKFGSSVTAILIDDRERRRISHIVLHAERTAQSVDKSGLSCTHFAIEGKHGEVVHRLYKLLCSLLKCLKRSYFNYFLFHIINYQIIQ